MKYFETATELAEIKASLLDRVRARLSQTSLPQKEAEDMLGRVAFEVDIAFQAIDNLTRSLIRNSK
jgi:hypothetical protein